MKDFETIKTIYNDNNNSFSGTQLEKNCKVFRATFPAIDGIDMDFKEAYDLPSFVDFCKMLIGMGFDITFCPYERILISEPWRVSKSKRLIRMP